MEERGGVEVWGYEAERVVLGSKEEEVVGVGLTLLDHSAARAALAHPPTRGRRPSAPRLQARAVRALHSPHLALSLPSVFSFLLISLSLSYFFKVICIFLKKKKDLYVFQLKLFY